MNRVKHRILNILKGHRVPNTATTERYAVHFKHFLWVVLCSIAMSHSNAAEANQPLEERRFFRPVRVGLCAGVSPDCPFMGLKTEFAGKYVGASVTLTGGIAAAIKAYPMGAYHSEKVSVRPYANFGAGTFWGNETVGGGIGADVHFFKSKRLLVQPSVSFQQVCEDPYGGQPPVADCELGPGGALSVMVAF